MARPQALVAHPILQGPDDVSVDRVRLVVDDLLGPEEHIERIDLLGDEVAYAVEVSPRRPDRCQSWPRAAPNGGRQVREGEGGAASGRLDAPATFVYTIR
jgi:hypothetical protein